MKNENEILTVDQKHRASHGDALQPLRNFILERTVQETDDVTARKYFFQEMIYWFMKLQRKGELNEKIIRALRKLILDNELFHANPPCNYTLIPPASEPKYKISIDRRGQPNVATNKSTYLAIAFLDKSLEYLSFFEPNRVWEGQHSSVERELYQVFKNLQDNYPKGHIPNVVFRDIGELIEEFKARERQELEKNKSGVVDGYEKKKNEMRFNEMDEQSFQSIPSEPFAETKGSIEYISFNRSPSTLTSSWQAAVVNFFSPTKPKSNNAQPKPSDDDPESSAEISVTKLES